MSQMDFFCLEKFCSNKIVLHCPSQKWKFWNNLSFSFGYHIFCCQIIRNEICIEINIGIDIFISSTGHITYSSLKRSWTFLKEFSGSSLCTDSVLVFFLYGKNNIFRKKYPWEFIVTPFLGMKQQVFWRGFEDKIGKYFYKTKIFANFAFKKLAVPSQKMGQQ